MKVAKVMFLWADIWREGVIEHDNQFVCGYCIQFGNARVALDYVTQWYYEDDPGTVFTNKKR
jgi:hypothetical protein